MGVGPITQWLGAEILGALKDGGEAAGSAWWGLVDPSWFERERDRVMSW